MSMEMCMSALTTPELSGAATNKLHMLSASGSIDWGSMWQLIVKYGPLAVKALEEILPLIKVGQPWTEILSLILATISKLSGQAVVV